MGGHGVRWLVIAGFLLAACASPPDLTSSEARLGSSKDELRLRNDSREFDREIREQGFVFEDEELKAYLTGVASRLAPRDLPEDFAFRVDVIRVSTMNAFALPNGSIYLHTGVLARMENEAQLAMLLGHEMAHVLAQDSLAILRDLKRKTVAKKVAEIVMTPVLVVLGGGNAAQLGNLGSNLAYMAAVSGYSREREAVADRRGLELMATAGYALDQAPRLFEALTEVDEPGIVTQLLLANHPRNRERRDDLRALVGREHGKRPPDERLAEAEYRAAVGRVVLENIRLRLRARHYRFALDEVERCAQIYGETAPLLYYRGEAHRRIAADPEAAAREDAFRRLEDFEASSIASVESEREEHVSAARAAYEAALALNPALSRAHRGLGELALLQSDVDEASRRLNLYLDAEPEAYDRRYIERLLRSAEEVGP